MKMLQVTLHSLKIDIALSLLLITATLAEHVPVFLAEVSKAISSCEHWGPAFSDMRQQRYQVELHFVCQPLHIQCTRFFCINYFLISFLWSLCASKIKVMVKECRRLLPALSSLCSHHFFSIPCNWRNIQKPDSHELSTKALQVNLNFNFW